jgi:hypothetical protein
LVNKAFIIGDLNHDLLSENGERLLELTDVYNLKNNVNEATRVTNTSSTLLDVVFCNDISLVEKASVVSCPFSDHSFVHIALTINSKNKKSSIYESRCLKDKSLNAIKQELTAFNTRRTEGSI